MIFELFLEASRILSLRIPSPQILSLYLLSCSKLKASIKFSIPFFSTNVPAKRYVYSFLSKFFFFFIRSNVLFKSNSIPLFTKWNVAFLKQEDFFAISSVASDGAVTISTYLEYFLK